MAADAHLPGHDHIVFDDRTAGQTDLRCQEHAPADGHAVRDLHQVVDFGARANARFADRGPIDRRVRANFDVIFDDHVGVLGDLQVAAVGLLREAEPVAAEHRAVLEDDAVANGHAFANGHVRVEHAVFANARASANDHVRIDDRAGADGRARADHDKWTDRHVGAERNIRGHGAQRIDAPGRRAVLHEQAHRAREGRIGIVRVQRGAPCRRTRLFAHRRRQNHGRRACRRELREVLAVRDKRQVARFGALNPGDALDVDRPVTFQATRQAFGDAL